MTEYRLKDVGISVPLTERTERLQEFLSKANMKTRFSYYSVYKDEATVLISWFDEEEE